MENITYAKGQIVELQETITTLQIQTHHLKKSIQGLCSKEDIAVNEVKTLLSEYELKSTKLSETFEEMFVIQDKWGLR